MVDNLLCVKNQARPDTALEHLLLSNQLERLAKNYLLACKVEGKSPRTIEVYTSAISSFIRQLNSQDITSNDIRNFLLSLQERGLKPSSVHQYYRSLKTFFNWLVDERFIDKTPMQNVKSPKIPKEIIKPFSFDDIAKILLLCSGRRLCCKNRQHKRTIG